MENESVTACLSALNPITEKVSGGLTVAKEYLTDAYLIRPDIEISNLLALSCMELHEYHEAKVILNKLNSRIPKNVSILTTLAKAEFLDNNPEKAKEYLEKVLAIFPESTEAKELMQNM